MTSVGVKANIEITPYGASFTEGWVFISHASGNAVTLDYQADFYASIEAFTSGCKPLFSKFFTVPYQAGDLVTLLYTHLMSLNLDEVSSRSFDQRMKCNISAGELITLGES